METHDVSTERVTAIPSNGSNRSTDGAVRELSTTELIQRAIHDVNRLVTAQIQLVRHEVREDLHNAIGASMVLGVGLVLLLGAYVALLGAIAGALTLLMPLWTAWLVELIVLAIVGTVVSWVGYNRLKQQTLPRTRESLREDVEWAKHQIRSNTN